MITVQELNRKIKEIPGEEGWWKSCDEKGFLKISNRLRERGISNDEVLEILESAYCLVANEFGG